MRRWLWLIVWLGCCLPAAAGGARCDCEPALRHLCRCGVPIDQGMAETQLAYLNRLLLVQFRPNLPSTPVAAVRVAPSYRMVLGGEATQGYYANGEIVLNADLQRDQALMVLAHELGHAWHFSAVPDPDSVSDFVAEGFAEWVAYHLMKRAGLVEHCSRLKSNPDPLYGEALRWFLSVEDEFGTDAVITIMRTWKSRDGTGSIWRNLEGKTLYF